MPDTSAPHAAEIGAFAEEIDAHRKRVLAAQKRIAVTALYNVREGLSAGRPLTPAERDIHEAGEVSVLAHLHHRLDTAVAAAYGWPENPSAEEIVGRVVALNAERRAEEADGLVRWLRPEYQAPTEVRQRRVQAGIGCCCRPSDANHVAQGEPERFAAVRAALASNPFRPPTWPAAFPGSSRRRWNGCWPRWPPSVRPGKFRLANGSREPAAVPSGMMP